MRTHTRPVFAANWKMNVGPTAAGAFLESFLSLYAPGTDRTVIVFPSALTFGTVRTGLLARPEIHVGVQNIHAEEKGAFTGENSAAIAADAGAAFVLVGHSERRHVFGETDADTARKTARAVEHGMVPVLCVGETIGEREASETAAVVLRQLRAGVSLLAKEAIAGIIIAYEPVWAIGTGRTATPDDAAAVHRVIRTELSVLTSADAAEIPILYGGSVTAANASVLLAADQVDGVLVGGASLDPAGWATICAA
ncbi:MAG: triose-phosphate isomerase [bacterium]